MNRALIGLASNADDRMAILERAAGELSGRFPSARFSARYQTEPVGRHSERRYGNGVGVLETDLPFDDLKALFKRMERAYGRLPDSKETGFVPLDLDIVVWNGRVLKPDDLRQGYLRQGLREVGWPEG